MSCSRAYGLVLVRLIFLAKNPIKVQKGNNRQTMSFLVYFQLLVGMTCSLDIVQSCTCDPATNILKVIAVGRSTLQPVAAAEECWLYYPRPFGWRLEVSGRTDWRDWSD